MTTVDDLLRWDQNFYSNRLGTGALVQELEAPGILNDGNKITYSMGLIPGNYRGLPTIEHNGSMFGYRADFLRFPDQRFTVICLCNVSNGDPEEKSRQVADIYLKSEIQSGSNPIAAVDRDLPDPAPFAGQYLDLRTHTIYSFTASDGHLRAWGSDLRRKNANQFYDLFGDLFTFEGSTIEGSRDAMKVLFDMKGETYFAGQRLSQVHLEDAALQAFTGDYRSPELDGAIQLSVGHGNLILNNRSNPPITLTPISNNEFKAADSFLIDFHRDRDGRVSGLTLFEHAARGIEFTRTKSSTAICVEKCTD